MSNVKQRMDIFFDHRAPSIVTDIAEYRNGYIDIRKRGGKIRCFTEVTKENVYHCKELMKLVDELRHLDGVRGGVAVSESEYMATTVLQEAKPLTQVIYSNVREVVEQGQYIFDTLWNAAIPAEQKIREIEEGIVPYYTKLINGPDSIIKEIIRIPYEIQELAFELVKSAQKEIRVIFSTANAFHRQEYAGGIQLLKEAIVQRGIKVRILTPKDDLIEEKVQKLAQQQIGIRYIEPHLQTKVSIIVTDDNSSLSVELKDDTKRTSYEAIGLATYSNSKPTVLSYISI